jgi:hypothetical protein
LIMVRMTYGSTGVERKRHAGDLYSE